MDSTPAHQNIKYLFAELSLTITRKYFIIIMTISELFLSIRICLKMPFIVALASGAHSLISKNIKIRKNAKDYSRKF